MNLSSMIAISPAYTNNKSVLLRRTFFELNLELQEGENVFESNFQDIGDMYGSTIQSKIKFWCSYDSNSKELTLIGDQMNDANSTCIITTIKESDQDAIQFGYKGAIPNSSKQVWNYDTPLTPGLTGRFRQCVDDITKSLIQAGLEAGLTVIVKTPPPELSEAEKDDLTFVYEEGKFKEIYNPEHEYDERHTFGTIESTWGGEVYFNHGENFANVIGSSGDRHIAGKTWIALWRDQFGIQNPTCTSLNWASGGWFNCGGMIVGGHVITGQHATRVPYGVNYVYIMPICHNHNMDDNVYMAANQYTQGIALHNYHNP